MGIERTHPVHIVAGYDAERSTQPDRFHQIPRVLKLQRLADIIEILHGINRILVHVGGHPQHQFQQLCNGGIRNSDLSTALWSFAAPVRKE